MHAQRTCRYYITHAHPFTLTLARALTSHTYARTHARTKHTRTYANTYILCVRTFVANEGNTYHIIITVCHSDA